MKWDLESKCEGMIVFIVFDSVHLSEYPIFDTLQDELGWIERGIETHNHSSDNIWRL